jgi:ATP-dependent DNA ligase
MARPLALAQRNHAALPEWIRPQLTQLVDAAPEGDQWLHEIKFEGYRMHARPRSRRGAAADPHWARLDG